VVESLPKTETLNFKLSQLVDFLAQFKDGDTDLQMICSWSGEPLPYVALSLDSEMDSHMKIVFSFKASEALIEFSKVSPTEVSESGRSQ
jgi:hypothetical protein